MEIFYIAHHLPKDQTAIEHDPINVSTIGAFQKEHPPFDPHRMDKWHQAVEARKDAPHFDNSPIIADVDTPSQDYNEDHA